jgi:hypothetical protein
VSKTSRQQDSRTSRQDLGVAALHLAPTTLQTGSELQTQGAHGWSAGRCVRVMLLRPVCDTPTLTGCRISRPR